MAKGLDCTSHMGLWTAPKRRSSNVGAWLAPLPQTMHQGSQVEQDFEEIEIVPLAHITYKRYG